MVKRYFSKKLIPAEIVVPGFIVTMLGAIFSLLSLNQYDNYLVLAFILLVSVFFIIIFPISSYISLIINSGIFGFYFSSQRIEFPGLTAGIYLVDVYLIALIVTTLGHIFLKKKPKEKPGKLTIFIFIFLLVTIFATFIGLRSTGHDSSLALGTMRRFFYALFYFPVYYLIKTKEQIKYILGALFMTSFIIFIFTIWGVINGTGVWTEFFPIYGGQRYLAAWQAFYATLAAISALSFIFVQKNKNHRIDNFLLLFVFQLPAVVFSLFRHMWLGVILIFAVDFIIISKNKDEDKGVVSNLLLLFSLMIVGGGVGIVILGLVGTLSSASGIFSNISSRLANIVSLTEMGSSFRLDMWTFGLEQFYDSPFTGIGFGGFFISAMPGYESGTYEIAGIHNTYLSILVQMGILGFLSFLAILIRFFSYSIKAFKENISSSQKAYLLAFFNIIIFISFAGGFGESWEGASTAFLGWGALAIFENLSKKEI